MSIRGSQSQVGDLEESLAALSVLEENLKKTDLLTEKMSTLLSTVFDARLGKLEENIKPMYNTTRDLTQISQSLFPFLLCDVDSVDIDLTIAAMDDMRKNFDTVPREEAIIRAGYVNVKKRKLMDSPKQNISEYLGSITRLQASLGTLSRSNIRSADNVQMQMVL